jgi:leucyl aminopeptidase (aminopeptidase T)
VHAIVSLSSKSRKAGKSSLAALYEEVARKVISESLHLKKGESVTVETWNNGLPIALKFVAEARRTGAIPLTLFEDEDTYVFGVKNAPADALGKMGKHEHGLLAASDAYIFIPNELLEGYTSRLTPEEVEAAVGYGSSWYEAAEKAGLRGARMSFGFAGKDLAKMLGKSPEEIEVHQLKAALADFGAIRKAGKDLASRLPDSGPGSLTSPGGSHLKFEYERGEHIEDGIVDANDVSTGHNMAYLPPGFLRKSVKPESVSGRVKLSPSVAWTGIIGDATLDFEKGRLVKWSSRSSRRMLDEAIEDQAEDERVVNALTIGLNPLMRYGYGQDRFVAGSIGVAGLSFTGIVRSGTLRAGHSVLVNGGRLVIPR